MKQDSNFKHLTAETTASSDDFCFVTVTFEGKLLELPKGANLAASLLHAGIRVFRNSPVSRAPRAPYCMMGSCYECLVEVDGQTIQACQCEVESNMDIKRGFKGDHWK